MGFYSNNANSQMLQSMYGGMSLQELNAQQQYLNNAIRNEQTRQQQLQRQMSATQMNPQQPMMMEQGIPGRLVDSEEEIKPNEVPMDGRASLFPKRDFSSIYAKAWNSNGTIQTIEYIPKIQDTQQSVEGAVAVPVSSDVNNQILERLDNIEKMLSNKTQVQQVNQKSNNNRQNNKKESVEDEQ